MTLAARALDGARPRAPLPTEWSIEVHAVATPMDVRNVVRVLVWERGAGETAASGSSAAAVAAAAVARGWADSPVRVAMPGGELVVTVDRGAVSLAGPAEQICEGTTPL